LVELYLVDGDRLTNWHETWQLHQELAEALCAGDGVRAQYSIEEQMKISLQLSLRVFDGE
jgi:hypothetical protein